MQHSTHVIETDREYEIVVFWDVIKCECTTDRESLKWEEATPLLAEIAGVGIYEFLNPETDIEHEIEKNIIEGKIRYE